MSNKKISFFIPDNSSCCEFAEAVKKDCCCDIRIIKASESSQGDFLLAVHRDDVVIVDCTIPEKLDQSSMYSLLVAQINVYDHILCFSRNDFPLNVVPRRKFISTDNNLISDWIKSQLAEITMAIEEKKHYFRVDLDLSSVDESMRNVSQMMQEAIAYNESHKQNNARVLISYRNNYYDDVKNFVLNIENYSKKYKSSDLHIIPPGKLCLDNEALTPMRRWMLTGLLDDRIREVEELWVYGTQDYWKSWWTLAELLLVLYFNQTSQGKKIIIKYIDVKKNCKIKTLPVKLPQKLSENQIKLFARFISNTRPETMGPEAKENIEEKRKLAQRLYKLKNSSFCGLSIGRIPFEFELYRLQYYYSHIIPAEITGEERKKIIDDMMDMYRNPEKLIAYLNDDIYSDDFWYKLSCQLTAHSSVYQSLSIFNGIPREITSENVDVFLQTPMQECINISEQKMLEVLTHSNQIELANSISPEKSLYAIDTIKPYYLWLATRAGNVQGTNGLEAVNRFLLTKITQSQ